MNYNTASKRPYKKKPGKLCSRSRPAPSPPSVCVPWWSLRRLRVFSRGLSVKLPAGVVRDHPVGGVAVSGGQAHGGGGAFSVHETSRGGPGDPHLREGRRHLHLRPQVRRLDELSRGSSCRASAACLLTNSTSAQELLRLQASAGGCSWGRGGGSFFVLRGAFVLLVKK